VRRRFFQRLEQRVERRRREHVHLVDDVDLELPLAGTYWHVSRNSRTCSTPLLLARQSPARPSRDLGDLFHARIIVVEVHLRAAGAIEAFGKDAGDGLLPVPRGPQNRYACAMRFCLMALLSVSVTCSWPTTSANRCGDTCGR